MILCGGGFATSRQYTIITSAPRERSGGATAGCCYGATVVASGAALVALMLNQFGR